VWSDEFSFTVLGVSGQPVKEFTVQVSNSGFQPSEIRVNKGDLVIINFVVSKEEAHPNGMRILSSAWKDAPVLMPGSTQRVEFTADSTFEYRLFWLAGNLLKATGKVNVE
ncbi:MAG: cupredoxin domain-containing protein, partial [Candidatus Micrarchaeota archaeon]|nr:cupredoxin domain-containing protein [Candidatus Micrarchaeota archaeon]